MLRIACYGEKVDQKDGLACADPVARTPIRKIRVNPSKPPNIVTKLLDERKILKQKIKLSNDENLLPQLEKEIDEIDVKIAEECSEENYKKVRDNFGKLSNDAGTLNNNGLWKIKKKIFPKNRSQLPVAKKNFSGQIITNPDTLKQLYIETYQHRLRHRPNKTGYENLKCLKETLFGLRLRLTKLTKSKPWNENDLSKVLSSLKNNKSRDPHGLINELFKPGVKGTDLHLSLMTLLNEIKFNCNIPEFVEWANITSLYKGKGEKMDLENERGIFIVTVFRSILMKLIYNDKYSIIGSNMPDSNVGARRKKNIRNHIFVINGIIYDDYHLKRRKL